MGGGGRDGRARLGWVGREGRAGRRNESVALLGSTALGTSSYVLGYKTIIYVFFFSCVVPFEVCALSAGTKRRSSE